MNSLRISQSCYAQLTSVYTNNIDSIVEFQLDDLFCFTGECLTRKSKSVNKWVSFKGWIYMFYSTQNLDDFDFRDEEFDVSQSPFTLTMCIKKQSPYLFIAKYSEEYIVFPKSIVMQQLLLCSLAQAFCNMWWQHNN